MYGDATPMGYMLREQVPERWMRIHSLPESKRYANTPSEYSILLERQNMVALEVLGSESECVVFIGWYPEGNQPVDIRTQLLPDINSSAFSLFMEKRDEDEELLCVWCATLVWKANEFDHIIKTIADDEVRYASFASLGTGEIYAPYDGGADLFLRSSSRRDELKRHYKDWLSAHPLGL